MKIKLLLLLFVGYFATAQENLSYQKPPKEILELADYERAPSVNMDSKKEYMLLSYRSTYKTLDDLNQEEGQVNEINDNPEVVAEEAEKAEEVNKLRQDCTDFNQQINHLNYLISKLKQ